MMGSTSRRWACSSVMPQRRSTSVKVTPRSSQSRRRRGKTSFINTSRSLCMSRNVDETKRRIWRFAGCWGIIAVSPNRVALASLVLIRNSSSNQDHSRKLHKLRFEEFRSDRLHIPTSQHPYGSPPDGQLPCRRKPEVRFWEAPLALSCWSATRRKVLPTRCLGAGHDSCREIPLSRATEIHPSSFSGKSRRRPFCLG